MERLRSGGWRENATQQLAAISGLQVQEYSHYDFGRATNPDCISVLVEESKKDNPFQAVVGLIDGVFGNPRAEKQALEHMRVLRQKMSPGLVAFIGTTRWLGKFKPHGVELVVGEGQSQIDIIRHAKSDAANYDLDTEALCKKLQQYNEQFGIDITHAESDTIRFKMLAKPSNLKAFAEDLYEFCPDLVDQGCGSVEALQEQIKHQDTICLWWD